MLRFPFRDNSYNTIYADPPWPEYGGGKIKRGADAHYPLMSIMEIGAVGPEVKRIAGENCHLYLWCTNNHLRAGLDILDDWGFRYITMITWGKDRIGLGQYYRGQTEHCLFGVRGRFAYRTLPGNGKRAQGTTLILAPRTEHSIKPKEMRAAIERVSYPPFIELFARHTYPLWDSHSVWGKE